MNVLDMNVGSNLLTVQACMATNGTLWFSLFTTDLKQSLDLKYKTVNVDLTGEMVFWHLQSLKIINIVVNILLTSYPTALTLLCYFLL